MAGKETTGRYIMKKEQSALNLIHARMMLRHIHEKMDEYVGTPIGRDEEMANTERNLQAMTSALVQKIDPEATTDVKMPRAGDGGHIAYFTITTSHPEKFGITLDEAM